MTSNHTMQAMIVEAAGGPEALVQRTLPVPEVKPGWCRIKIKAFGLNRAEMYTRQGHSPSVTFPRVIGIECVGTLDDASDSGLAPGTTVATMMGEMGRAYDGSYAEYTLVPSAQVIPLNTALPWARLAGIPEMFQTAHGSLHQVLRLRKGQTLLVRGGTSSVGLTAIDLARNLGATVAATSRKPEREGTLRDAGAQYVFIDDGQIASQVRAEFDDGVDAVLELVGTTTLTDSLQCVAPGGCVCMTGILGNSWSLKEFAPMESIPTGVYLSAYSGTGMDAESLQSIVADVEADRLRLNLDRVFRFNENEIREAHSYMESGAATGKLVVVVDDL